MELEPNKTTKRKREEDLDLSICTSFYVATLLKMAEHPPLPLVMRIGRFPMARDPLKSMLKLRRPWLHAEQL